jgi:hypothetical protein
MINYSEKNVLDLKVKRCLEFDPFMIKNEKYCLAKVTEKMKIEDKNELKLKYYNCSNTCFEIYENLPVMTFHYEISCDCIYKCYLDLESKLN